MSNESGQSESNENVMSGGAQDKQWSGNPNDTGLGSWQNELADWMNGGIQQQWQDMPGMMRITPKIQKQTYVATTIASIADGMKEPGVETFPISDPQMTPHQISFDFFDTTEGKVGVSNATEKHFILECDVYITDLIYMYWNHGNGGDQNYSKNSIQSDTYAAVAKLVSSCQSNDIFDFEYTTEFAKFRRSFLQQHSGWICTFTSSMFETFEGVITEVTYEIPSGETSAKFHLKIEEAVFTDDYSSTGVKKQDDNGNSGGSKSNSGENSLMTEGDMNENTNNNLLFE